MQSTRATDVIFRCSALAYKSRLDLSFRTIFLPDSFSVDLTYLESLPISKMSAEKQSIKGSCHCKNIQYTANVALPDPPTATRCNCTVCQKTGATNLRLDSLDDFKLITPSSLSDLPDYQFRSKDVHRVFCNKCGVHVIGHGFYEFEGNKYDFVTLNLITVDQPQEGIDLSKFKISYYDGLTDNFSGGTKEAPWPNGLL